MGRSLLSAVPHSVVFNARNSFYRFHNESFTTIGIFPGDFAVVEQGPVASGRMAAIRTPNLGDIVRVILFERGRIRLKALHPQYRDLYYTANELHIAGPVVDVYPASDLVGVKAARPDLFALEYSIPAFKWAADPSGMITEISETGALAAGVRQDQMLGWGWARVVHPEQRPLVEERWLESIKTGKPYYVEFLAKTCIGRYRHSMAEAFPVYHDGKIVEWDGRWRIV